MLTIRRFVSKYLPTSKTVQRVKRNPFAPVFESSEWGHHSAIVHRWSTSGTMSASPESKKGKKMRVAALFLYRGTAYSGLQINPGVKTVESEIMRAMCEAEAFRSTNQQDFQRTGWNRAARTDKGVHACGQVLSMKVQYRPDLLGDIQSRLPEDIHLVNFLRVSKSFNSKNACQARTYEYLLPSYCMAPVQEVAEGKLQVLPDSDERVESAVQALCRVKARLLHDLCVHHQDTPDFPERSEVFARFLPKVTPPELTTPPLSADSLTSQFQKCSGQAGDTGPAPLPDSIASYRISPTRITAINAVLERYVGTHNFHNFTKRIQANDPSANRVMSSFVVAGTQEVEGVEYLRLRVKGDSFMLHQIRKMVACAVCVMRGVLPATFLDDSLGFSKTQRLRVPMAPALGLYLRRLHYDFADTRLCKFAVDLANDKNYVGPPIRAPAEVNCNVLSSEEWKSVEAGTSKLLPEQEWDSSERRTFTEMYARSHGECEQFLQEHIHSTIVSTDRAEHVNYTWLLCMDAVARAFDDVRTWWQSVISAFPLKPQPTHESSSTSQPEKSAAAGGQNEEKDATSRKMAELHEISKHLLENLQFYGAPQTDQGPSARYHSRNKNAHKKMRARKGKGQKRPRDDSNSSRDNRDQRVKRTSR